MLRSRAQVTSAARCSRRAAHRSASSARSSAVPGGGIRGAVHPALAEVAVEQRAHRIADPRRQVHAVGHVADRHVVDGAIGPQRGPHLAGDLAVAAADAVARAARVQGELRHAERLALVLGARAAEAQDRVEVDADLVGERAQRLAHELGLVGVVAGRHRRVRGEDRARAGRGQRVVERGARGQLGARQLQRGEGGVALVEVHDGRVDPHAPRAPACRRRRAAGTGPGAGRGCRCTGAS